MPEKLIGTISDFFSRPVVAGIDLTDTLKVGDNIHIKGHTTDLRTTIASMQIDNKIVEVAKKGEAVGIKVPDRVRRGDEVFVVTD